MLNAICRDYGRERRAGKERVGVMLSLFCHGHGRRDAPLFVWPWPLLFWLFFVDYVCCSIFFCHFAAWPCCFCFLYLGFSECVLIYLFNFVYVYSFFFIWFNGRGSFGFMPGKLRQGKFWFHAWEFKAGPADANPTSHHGTYSLI